MPEYCEEQADCLKGIDIREWPERCYACGHSSAQAQAKESKNPKTTNEAVVSLNNLLTDDRIDYLKRLIDGVREEVDKHSVEIDGDKCHPSEWVDAWLICEVVEKDILGS